MTEPAGFAKLNNMTRTVNKFLALFLAIWLPLFGGNALAASIAIQPKQGDCHAAMVQQKGMHEACGQAMQEHGQHASVAMDKHDGHHGQQNSSGESCDTCQLACSGYLVTPLARLMDAPQPDRLPVPASIRFQSIVPPLLDPPPLTRA